MNEYDSNRILDLTKKINYTPTNNLYEADCYILNTCHIREKATDKVYHDIGRIKKRFRDGIDMNPETQLVTIALKKGAQVEVKEVLERVDDAGYDAIEKYKLHDGHLDAHKFKKDASVEIVHHTPHK